MPGGGEQAGGRRAPKGGEHEPAEKKPSLPSQAENKRAKGLDLCMTEHIWYKICSNAAAVAKEQEWRNGRGTTYVRSV